MTGPQGSQQRFEWNAGNVRALRRFLGMSQSMFAAELGVRQQTVSEWETGMYRPRGASATLLTMFAANAGFIHDGPAYAHSGALARPSYAGIPAGFHGGAATDAVGPLLPAADPVRLPGAPPKASLARPEVAI